MHTYGLTKAGQPRQGWLTTRSSPAPSSSRLCSAIRGLQSYLEDGLQRITFEASMNAMFTKYFEDGTLPQNTPRDPPEKGLPDQSRPKGKRESTLYGPYSMSDFSWSAANSNRGSIRPALCRR